MESEPSPSFRWRGAGGEVHCSLPLVGVFRRAVAPLIPTFSPLEGRRSWLPSPFRWRGAGGEVRWRATISRVTLAILLLTTFAHAQNAPHLGYVFPAGGQRGQTVEVTLGGQYIANPRLAVATLDGLDATVRAYDRPLTQREVQLIQQKLEDAKKTLTGEEPKDKKSARKLGGPAQIRELAKIAGVTDEELRKVQEFRQARNDPKRQLNSQISETVKLSIRIAPNAVTGIHELRLVTNNGISNPVRFVVGSLPEVQVSDPAPKSPFTLNGRILPGEVQRYSFEAATGQCLVFTSQARELDPYLADAVPGRFQLSMRLLDPQGKEVASADHYLFHPDPVFAYRTKVPGTYQLEVRDALYRGREDFVYRISVGATPFITDVFPLGGNHEARLDGWNLPLTKLMLPEGANALQMKLGNSVPIAEASNLPEIVNPTAGSLLKLPVIVNGKIYRAGDTVVYRFKGKAGGSLVAQVTARRLGSPLDSTVELLDAKGKVIAANDDSDDKSAGLLTHQADSYLQTILPTTGVYTVRIRDTQGKGGPEFAYRLRLSEPQPDYQLFVTPSSISARAGTTVPLTVYVVRKDGFKGEVSLRLKDAPEGFLLGGGYLGRGVDRARVTLSVPDGPNAQPYRLNLEGVSDRVGSRTAIPMDDLMQAFAYRHWVQAQGWFVQVFGNANRGLALRGPDQPIMLPLGKSVEVRLTGRLGQAAARLQTVLQEGPDGVIVEKAEIDRTGVFLVLRADPAKAKIGASGNVIFDVFTNRAVPANGKNKATTRRVSLGTFPAIPVEVVN